MANNVECTKWISFEIDISDSTKISDEVNLGGVYESAIIHIPTITAATLTVQAVRTAGGTAGNLHTTDPADGGDNVLISASATGAIFWAIPLGGVQYLKLVSSAAQEADRVFYIRGIGKIYENRG